MGKTRQRLAIAVGKGLQEGNGGDITEGRGRKQERITRRRVVYGRFQGIRVEEGP